MKNKLESVKQFLLNVESPGEWLGLADMYMENYRNTRMSLVPVAHASIEPLVSELKDDLVGFMNFVLSVRDDLTGPRRVQVQEFYRKLRVREAQITRRQRLSAACDVVQRVRKVTLSNGQRQRAAAWFETEWAKERTAALSDARRKTSSGRLSSDERTAICDEFWAEVEKETSAQSIRLPPESVYE